MTYKVGDKVVVHKDSPTRCFGKYNIIGHVATVIHVNRSYKEYVIDADNGAYYQWHVTDEEIVPASKLAKALK